MESTCLIKNRAKTTLRLTAVHVHLTRAAFGNRCPQQLLKKEKIKMQSLVVKRTKRTQTPFDMSNEAIETPSYKLIQVHKKMAK